MFTITLEVARSIHIDRPLSYVHEALSNFKNWPHWSPWLCMDKQAQLDFFGEDGTPGSGYRWSSKWIGEGEIQLQHLSEEGLEMRLEIFTPWRLVASVFFNLVSLGDRRTEVTWTMQGDMPVLLFFMKSAMQSYIAMDYQRGLLMLKDYLETGWVMSDTEVCGIVEVPDVDFVGVRRVCLLEGIGLDMKAARSDLLAAFGQTDLKRIAEPFTLLHEWNLKTRRCDYTFAYPIEAQQNISDTLNLIQSTRPSVKALKLQHTGEYKHLGNAWAIGHSRIQNDKTLKLDKKQSSFEIYISDPEKTAAKELLTEIYIPVK
jgi:effector-binding domain-containing protein